MKTAVRRCLPSKMVPLLLLCGFFLSGCAYFGGSSNAPPNPVSQSQSQSQASNGANAPVYYDFADIPIPPELKLVRSDSYVFQAGPLKAGMLTLKGRVEISSLVNYFTAAMPRQGWTSRGGFRYRRSVLIYEKPNKTCVIDLRSSTFYTYVEIYVAPNEDTGTAPAGGWTGQTKG